MVIYSREEWAKNNPELTSINSNISKKISKPEDQDEITEIINDNDDFYEKRVEEKTSSTFINIANCSNENIMIPDLFGPGSSLILGTLEKPSEKSAAPVIQVDGSFRNRLSQHQHYQRLLEKNLLKEVSNKTMGKFLNTFYSRIGNSFEELRMKEESEIQDMNLFVRGEDEQKVRESIDMDEGGVAGHVSSGIDILPPSGKTSGSIIDIEENEEMDVLRELGINPEERLSRFQD